MYLCKQILLFGCFQSTVFSNLTLTITPDDVLSTVKSVVQ